MWKLSKIAERENKKYCIVWIHKNSGRISLLYETLILFVLLVCSWILFTSEEQHIGVLKISKRSPVLWPIYGLYITKDRHKYLSQYSVSMKKGCQWCSSEKNNYGMHTTIRRNQGSGPARELSFYLNFKSNNQWSELQITQPDGTDLFVNDWDLKEH